MSFNFYLNSSISTLSNIVIEYPSSDVSSNRLPYIEISDMLEDLSGNRVIRPIMPLDVIALTDRPFETTDPEIVKTWFVASNHLMLEDHSKARETDYLRARKELMWFIRSKQNLKDFHGILETELYKLFIDGNRWPKHEQISTINEQMTFDVKEPGYTKAMMNGFQFLFRNLDRPIDSQWVLELHDIATSGVASGGPKGYLESGYRSYLKKDHMETFGLELGSTLTEQGKNELIGKMRNNRYNFIFKDESWNVFNLFVMNPRNTIERIAPKEQPRIKLYPPRTPGILEAAVDHLLFLYHDAKKNTLDEKLTAIIQLVQDLEQIHPFYDGNIRTFAILLIQRLLVDEGLTPACFLDPNCFDCLSVEQLKIKLIQAQELFLSLKAT